MACQTAQYTVLADSYSTDECSLEHAQADVIEPKERQAAQYTVLADSYSTDQCSLERAQADVIEPKERLDEARIHARLLQGAMIELDADRKAQLETVETETLQKSLGPTNHITHTDHLQSDAQGFASQLRMLEEAVACIEEGYESQLVTEQQTKLQLETEVQTLRQQMMTARTAANKKGPEDVELVPESSACCSQILWDYLEMTGDMIVLITIFLLVVVCCTWVSLQVRGNEAAHAVCVDRDHASIAACPEAVLENQYISW